MSLFFLLISRIGCLVPANKAQRWEETQQLLSFSIIFWHPSWTPKIHTAMSSIDIVWKSVRCESVGSMSSRFRSKGICCLGTHLSNLVAADNMETQLTIDSKSFHADTIRLETMPVSSTHLYLPLTNFGQLLFARKIDGGFPELQETLWPLVGTVWNSMSYSNRIYIGLYPRHCA